jgi:hypothetical protein
MKSFAVSILFLVFSSVAVATEWCPKHENKFPAAVVDLGQYKIFYFVPNSIYSEEAQVATVLLTKDKRIFEVSTAQGGSDWFSSTEYKGERSGFSCDSVSLDFQYAWYMDENGQRIVSHEGEVRATGFKQHDLACSEE